METLQCPSCGAPLDYDPRGAGETMRCPFCESTVLLPEHARPAQPQFVVQTSYAPAARNAPVAGVIVAVLIILGVAVLIALTISRAGRTPSTRTGVSANTRNTLVPTKDGYAQPELAFGSEGIGPGNFKDARSVAVDADGHIYVGEYSGGRVQVFDPSGKFLSQWTVDPKMPLRGFAADRRGTVYVVQSDTITRYEGATGRPLGVLASGGYDDVATTADGGLVAFAWNSRDDIVRLDSSGRVTKQIRAAMSGQTDKSELNGRVAADGLGQIYALGTFNNAVFKFSPDGRFLTQFGGDGDQPGQFRAPSSIAVDNQGRVFVGDFKGVQVFDPGGRYLGLIKVRGAASGLAFNDKGELFVASRTQVYKFAPFSP
jgi:LSD1 subclass zinc finger protein